MEVSMNLVKIEARRLDPEIVERVGEVAFKHRMYRHMKSWRFSYRRSTTTNKVPQNTRHAADVVSEFVAYYKFKVNLLGVSEDDIFNCDQTNLPFSLEAVYTWARMASRSVAVSSSDTSQRATVMLGANASGTTKLPPYLVFKGSSKSTGRIFKELRKGEGYTPYCKYSVNEKAWFNEEVMLDWIEVVWKPITVDRGGKLTYLLLDEFAVHVTSSVEAAFADLNTEVDIIPGGYTPKLQPMDVGINKPFKGYCRQEFEKWLARHHDGTRPHRRHAAAWAADSWERISTSTIRKTWNHIGYTSFPVDGPELAIEMEPFESQTETICGEKEDTTQDITQDITQSSTNDVDDDVSTIAKENNNNDNDDDDIVDDDDDEDEYVDKDEGQQSTPTAEKTIEIISLLDDSDGESFLDCNFLEKKNQNRTNQCLTIRTHQVMNLMRN
jgi:DDE superfamily endonuclease